MAQLTQVFEEHWSILKKEIDMLNKEGFFPIKFHNSKQKDITYDDECKTLNNFANGEFTIAICGRVKVGKSTFLNSLLFEKDILPSFPTPTTSKPTFIKYTDKQNFFRIHFYSEQEFEELKIEYDGEEKTKFNKRIEYCSNHENKNSPKKFIGKPVEENYDLSKLIDYIADPISGSNKEKVLDPKAPYVKYVEVFINNPNIKNITIVDTPGLGDPDPVNSRETIKLFNSGKVHALIYLLQPEGAKLTDIRDISREVASSPESRIFIINRIDEYKKQEELKIVIDTLYKWGRELSECKNINLFDNNEQIYGYSSLITLLRKKQEHGEYIKEAEKIKLKQKENLDSDPHKIASKIANTLFKNKGKEIVETVGISEINRIYGLKADYLQKQIDTTNDNIKILQESTKELNKKTDEANDALTKLDSKTNKVIEEIRSYLDEKWKDKLREIKTEIIDMQKELTKLFNVDEIIEKQDANALKSQISLAGFKSSSFSIDFKANMNVFWNNLKKDISTKHQELLERLQCDCEIKEKPYEQYFNNLKKLPLEIKLDLSDVMNKANKIWTLIPNWAKKWPTLNMVDCNKKINDYATEAKIKIDEAFDKFEKDIDVDANYYKYYKQEIERVVQEHSAEYSKRLHDFYNKASEIAEKTQKEKEKEFKEEKENIEKLQEEANKWSDKHTVFKIKTNI